MPTSWKSAGWFASPATRAASKPLPKRQDGPSSRVMSTLKCGLFATRNDPAQSSVSTGQAIKVRQDVSSRIGLAAPAYAGNMQQGADAFTPEWLLPPRAHITLSKYTSSLLTSAAKSNFGYTAKGIGRDVLAAPAAARAAEPLHRLSARLADPVTGKQDASTTTTARVCAAAGGLAPRQTLWWTQPTIPNRGTTYFLKNIPVYS